MTLQMVNIVTQVFRFLKKPAQRIILLGLLCSGHLYAQGTFTTRADGDWSSAATWLAARPADDLIVAGTYSININHNVSTNVASAVLDIGATGAAITVNITIAAGRTLTINNSLIVNGGSTVLNISGLGRLVVVNDLVIHNPLGTATFPILDIKPGSMVNVNGNFLNGHNTSGSTVARSRVTTTIQGRLTVTGTVENTSPSAGLLTVTGTLFVQSNFLNLGVLDNRGTVIIENGYFNQDTGAAVLTIYNGAALSVVNGNLQNDGNARITVQTGGDLALHNGILRNTGTAFLTLQTGVDIDVSGSLENTGSATLTLEGTAYLDVAGNIQNNATITSSCGIDTTPTLEWSGVWLSDNTPVFIGPANNYNQASLEALAAGTYSVNLCNTVVQTCTQIWYIDSDHDGFGLLTTSTNTACGASAPTGYSANSLDCNDATVNATVWYPLETEVFNRVGIDPRMEVASDGTPYVMFADFDLRKGTVVKYVNQHWSLVGPRGFSEDLANNSSISMSLYSASTTTLPYVSYAVDLTNVVSVLSFNGTAWQQVGSSFASSVSATDIDINTADANGEPYVVYNNFSTDDLFVKRFTGGSWVDVGASLGTGVYPRIAVDNTGIPYVAFSDNDNGGGITVKRYQGGTWTTVGTAGFSAADVESVQIVIDAFNIPSVAYFDYGDFKVVVQKFSAGNWTPVGSNDIVNDYASSVSLDSDFAGTLYVAYASNITFAVKKLDQTNTWIPVSDPVTAATGEKISIATAPDGIPYIAFGNFNNSDRVSAMQVGAESCPLAVKLLYFKALAQEKEIKLSWATATEVNADHFSIERSPDGKNFLPVAHVPADGNSSEAIRYTFTDEQPLHGKNYYRLKSVDADGAFEYSKLAVAEMEHGASGTFALYPNPTRGYAVSYILDAEPIQGAQLQVINSLGVVVHRMDVSKQSSEIIFDKPLATGYYIVQYLSSGRKHSARLVVIQE